MASYRGSIAESVMFLAFRCRGFFFESPAIGQFPNRVELLRRFHSRLSFPAMDVMSRRLRA